MAIAPSTLTNYTLNQEDSVLLIIDIQERLIPAVKDSEQVIKNAYILLTTAQKLGVPVIATEQHPNGLGKDRSQFKQSYRSAVHL